MKKLNSSKTFQSDEEYVDSYLNSINTSKLQEVEEIKKKKRSRAKERKREKEQERKRKKAKAKKDKKKKRKRKKAAFRIEITTRNGSRHKYKIDPKILSDPKKLKAWLELKCADKE